MCFPTAPISRCSSFVRLCVNLAQFVSSGRDATMILLAYRHGLRVSELVGLRREQVDLRQGLLHVRRRKNGLPSTHPLRGPELRALHKVLRDDPDAAYVFVSERRAPMTAATFRKLVARAGEAAGLGMPIHSHMLRHSTGFKLANDGQDTRAIQLYLGHRNIQHTVLYTQLATNRFNDFWNDWHDTLEVQRKLLNLIGSGNFDGLSPEPLYGYLNGWRTPPG